VPFAFFVVKFLGHNRRGLLIGLRTVNNPGQIFDPGKPRRVATTASDSNGDDYTRFSRRCKLSLVAGQWWIC
jgi:hypothetical protein